MRRSYPVHLISLLEFSDQTPAAGAFRLASLRATNGFDPGCVEFILSSGDVIHSFWIPSLGPKMDMIPGRQTGSLFPTRVGRFRGVCAEYCGTSHALMALDVVVMEKPKFEAWLVRQAEPAG